MARSIADAALFLDALAGENAHDPISLPRLPESFLAAARTPRKPRRIAFSAGLGITPVDPEVSAICRAAAEKLAGEGVLVEEAHPDFSGVHEAFQTLRAHFFAASHGQKLRDYPHLLKPEMIWNVEKGLKLGMAELIEADAWRAALIARTLAFFDDYDLLLTPAAIVPPFPNELRHVEECAGQRFGTYMDWLAIAYAVTLTTAPALSMPCGFTATGLPVGLQVVARPRGERDQASYAAFMEPIFGAMLEKPIDPRS
jgi:amidase